MNPQANRSATRRGKTLLYLGSVLASALLPLGVTHAQAQRSGGGGANAQIMQQYQQLASDRTRLQAENDKLKADLDAASKERDALKKERDALKARAGKGDNSTAQIAAATAAADQKLSTQRRQMDELIARYRDMGTNLQDVERQRGTLQAQNEKIVQIATQCAEQNAKLRDVTTEVLDRYEHMGSFSKATIDEPFTRLTRTRVENLVDEARGQVDQLKAIAPVAAPGTR